MASVSELLLQGLKSVFSDVAEDELTEGLKSTLKGLAENSSKDVVETLSKESAENIGKIISHDVEYLGASSLEDYLGKTSIFKNADDLGGIISELVKNGDIVRDTGEAVKETGKEVLNNTVEKVAENIADILINVPSKRVYRIQEYHLPIYHLICLCVESELFEE